MNLKLRLKLRSDASFSSGYGVAGLVDAEVEHDQYGLPFIRGRTLKGLLVEECANLLAQPSPLANKWTDEAFFLFGRPGSGAEVEAGMKVGPALMPQEIRNAVKTEVENKRLTSTDILESITTIRRQTAVDEISGTPAEGSLRSVRVVLRETIFSAELSFAQAPDERAKALLAACTLALRRGGSGRNRGRGNLEASLWADDKDETSAYFQWFKKALVGG